MLEPAVIRSNLDQYPINFINLDESQVLTLGDLQGNLLYLLYAVVSHGYVTTSAEDYAAIAQIYMVDDQTVTGDADWHAEAGHYRTPLQLTPEHVDTFMRLLAGLQAGPAGRGRRLRLIGDNLADRGVNDYLTLRLIERLVALDIEIEILYSNHDASMLGYGCGSMATLDLMMSYIVHYRSSANLCKMIVDPRFPGVTMPSIRQLLKNVYLPRVKLLALAEGIQGERYFYSHAPVGYETLYHLCALYKVPFHIDGRLPQTVQAVNDAFQAEVMKSDDIAGREPGYEPLLGCTAQAYRDVMDAGDDPMGIPYRYPVMRVIWNRGVGYVPVGHITKPNADPMPIGLANTFELEPVAYLYKTLQSHAMYGILDENAHYSYMAQCHDLGQQSTLTVWFHGHESVVGDPDTIQKAWLEGDLLGGVQPVGRSHLPRMVNLDHGAFLVRVNQGGLFSLTAERHALKLFPHPDVQPQQPMKQRFAAVAQTDTSAACPPKPKKQKRPRKTSLRKKLSLWAQSQSGSSASVTASLQGPAAPGTNPAAGAKRSRRGATPQQHVESSATHSMPGPEEEAAGGLSALALVPSNEPGKTTFQFQ